MAHQGSFFHLSIAGRLIFLAVSVIVILIAVTVIGINKFNQSFHDTEFLADTNTGLIGLVDSGRHLQALFKELRISAIKYPMTETAQERVQQKEAFSKNKQNFLNVLNDVRQRCGKHDKCASITKGMSNLLTTTMKMPRKMKLSDLRKSESRERRIWLFRNTWFLSAMRLTKAWMASPKLPMRDP